VRAWLHRLLHNRCLNGRGTGMKHKKDGKRLAAFLSGAGVVARIIA